MGMNLLIIITVWALGIFSPGPFYSDLDAEILSAIIHAECGECPDKEKYLVGSVVLNRVESNRFPNTVYDVVSQEGQFDGYMGNQYKNIPHIDDIAENLLYNCNRTYGIYFFVREDMSNNHRFIQYVNSDGIIKAKYHTFKIGL